MSGGGHTFLIIVLVMMYVVVGLGLVFLNSTIKCMGGNALACKFENMGDPSQGKCGRGILTNCESFVLEEECFCSRCGVCLDAEQRQHCEKSREERTRLCQLQLDSGET